MDMQNNVLGKASVGYCMLAAAIIRSGERENDQAFLNSEWCNTLRTMINLRTSKGSKELSGTSEYNKYI